MKCYFSNDNDMWHPGHIDGGPNLVSLTYADKPGGLGSITLARPEYQFLGNVLCIAGYRDLGGDDYRLDTVCVVFNRSQVPKRDRFSTNS